MNNKLYSSILEDFSNANQKQMEIYILYVLFFAPDLQNRVWGVQLSASAICTVKSPSVFTSIQRKLSIYKNNVYSTIFHGWGRTREENPRVISLAAFLVF